MSQENKNVFIAEFKCKPKPTKITWKVVDETICKDDLSCEITVTTDSKLEDEDKDKHFHLKYDESKDVFKARLTLITDEETETLKTNGNFTVTISNGVAQKEVIPRVGNSRRPSESRVIFSYELYRPMKILYATEMTYCPMKIVYAIISG